VTLTSRWFAVVVLVALFVGLAGCRNRSRSGRASNDLLIVGYDREPDTLNRFSTHILEDIQTCIVEGLTTTDEQMRVVPLLATEVPTIDNGGVRLRGDGGMDVTWKLRPGVTWHDGAPFTSADVKFTVDAINGPEYNPESTDGFDRISGVDTPDSLTAVVHYREIYAPYDIQFIRGALPRHILQGRDIDRAQDYNRNPLGTGPYHVVEWKSGEYILLERVAHYWRGDGYPKIRRLLFKFIPNTNTRINQLKNGEVHVVALAPWDKYREMAAVPSIVVAKTRGNAYEHVTLNERQFPPFADVRVRRALISALDREGYARTILDGLAPVAHGPIQPVSWAYNDRIARYGFDPAKARALLDDAGWTAGADGIRTRNGQRLAFTLITQAGFAIRESVAQAIERQLRDVRRRDGGTSRRHGDQRDLVRGTVRGDAALVADAVGSRADDVLRRGPDAAGGTEHQLLPRRGVDAAAVCVGSHRRSGRAQAAARARAGDHRRRRPGNSALQRDAPRRRSHHAGELQRQSHEHRHLLERPRMGDQELDTSSCAAACTRYRCCSSSRCWYSC